MGEAAKKAKEEAKRAKEGGQAPEEGTDAKIDSEEKERIPVQQSKDSIDKQKVREVKEIVHEVEDDGSWGPDGACPLGHPLVPVFSLDDDDVEDCDICKAKSDATTVIARCKKCKQHVCKKCRK